MQLQIGGRRSGPVRFIPEVTDPPQLIFAAEAVPIDTVVDVLAREAAGERARCGVRWFEARPLFVSPVDHLDGAAGHDPDVIQRAHDLQRAEHTVRPVVLAALGDRIEVGAKEYCGT